MSLPIVQAYIRIRSGTAYVVTKGTTMSSRPFLCTRNMYYYQQRWVYKISNQPFYHIPNSPIIVCLPKYPPQFSLLAAIHLFISSRDEIKDFCSMDKKTGRRYLRRIRIYT